MQAKALLIGIAAVLLAVDAPAQPSAPDPARGKLLYETHCIECHSTQMHWRDARTASDWPSLLSQVRRWQERADLQWNDEDIDAVARYLNDTIYHFSVRQTRDVVTAGGSRGSP